MSLPINVHLLTYEPWERDAVNGHSYLLRFEHLLEKDDDPEYSKAVKFNLEDVFRNLDIQNIRETSLAANQWLSDVKRFKFVADPPKTRYDSDDKKFDYSVPNNHSAASNQENEINSNEEPRLYGIDYEISLKPMEIRTFVIQLMPQF